MKTPDSYLLEKLQKLYDQECEQTHALRAENALLHKYITALEAKLGPKASKDLREALA